MTGIRFGMERLETTLARLADARVAVFGDFALDAYWTLDPDHDERSLETGLPVRRVLAQRYTLGGAANVAANAAALGCGAVTAVGLTGDDLFGRELRARLAAAGVDTAALHAGPAEWHTTVFAKPSRGGIEESRLDFGTRNTLPAELVPELAARLATVAATATAVILNQQTPAGVTTPAMVERQNAIIAQHPERVFVANSREHAGRYRGAVIVANESEAAHWCGGASVAGARSLARELHRRTGSPTIVTRGPRGMVAADAQDTYVEPGIPVPPPVDPVGAGDAATAAVAAALGSGCDLPAAARLANLAAAVTVMMLHTTGVATPDAIRALAARHGNDA